MKRLLLAVAVICLLFSACRKGEGIEPMMVDVQVSFSDLNISVTPEDSKSVTDTTVDGTNVKRIVLKIFDLNGTLINSASQDKDSDPTNFGQPMTIRVPVGSYKFVAVAHSTRQSTDPTAVINSATEVDLGSGLVNNPTYTTVQDVTIAGNTSQAVQINFGTRKNAAFVIKITDATPADVQSLQLIVSPTADQYTNLLVNPSTGLATALWRYAKQSYRSTTGYNTYTNYRVNLPLFLTTNSAQLDVTINALDASNNVLYTRTLSNVPFQQAHKTLATGTFFSPEATSNFTFNITEINDTISLD